MNIVPHTSPAMSFRTGYRQHVRAAILCIAGLGNCDRETPGTETRLADLENVRLQARAINADELVVDRPSLVEERLAGEMVVEVEIWFLGAGDEDATGERCPKLSSRAVATIAGHPVVFTSLGGGRPEGLIRAEYYRCATVGFVSAVLTPPFGDSIDITLTDGSSTLEAAFSRLFVSREATLVDPNAVYSYGSDVEIAWAGGDVGTSISGTLWQRRNRGAWGGFSLRIVDWTSERFRIRLVVDSGAELLAPGEHMLEVSVGGLEANVVSCSGAQVCQGKPYDRAGPFPIAIRF